MPTVPPEPGDVLRHRVEAHLLRLGCGLRQSGTVFEVYDRKDGRVVLTFADMTDFARANGIEVDMDGA